MGQSQILPHRKQPVFPFLGKVWLCQRQIARFIIRPRDHLLPSNGRKSFPTWEQKICAEFQAFCFNAHRFKPLRLHIHDGTVLLECWKQHCSAKLQPIWASFVCNFYSSMVPTCRIMVFLLKAGIPVAMLDRKWAVDSAAWTAWLHSYYHPEPKYQWAVITSEVFPLHLTICQYKPMMARMCLTWTSLLPWLIAMARGG